MDRKKVLKRGFTILLLVLLGVEACMELRYPCSELSVTSRDTEKILRRTPEAAITEEDRAMMAELLALPSVQGLLESGESGDLPASENPDIRDTAGTYLDGESAESLAPGRYVEGRGVSVYLHLGQNEIIPQSRIIGIFDLDKCSYEKRTRDYLAAAEKEGVVLDISGDLPRSFVVCDHPYHEQIVYLSQLSPAALQRRAESGKLE